MTRVSRGFHRIGVVAAVPLLLLSGGWAASTWWQTPHVCAGMFDDLIPGAPACRSLRAPGKIDYTKMTDQQLLAIYNSSPRAIRSPVPEPDYVWPLLGAASALALYSIVRALGWIIDGFRA